MQCLLFSINKTSSQTFFQLSLYIQSSLFTINKEDLSSSQDEEIKTQREDFLVIQWLRLPAPSAGGPGSVLVQGTRSYMPQRRSKILRATTKTWYSQLNKYFKKNKTQRIEVTCSILHS